jgi:hypothetical protein
MVIWTSKYEESTANAEILASASEIFFSTDSAKQQISKHQQSFNNLEINNDDNASVLGVDLDGLISRRRLLYPKSSLSITGEDGIFFNNVKITNLGAGAVAINKIRLNARISTPRGL